MNFTLKKINERKAKNMLKNFKTKLINIKNLFLENLFPSKFSCFNCGEEISKQDNDFCLCKSCFDKIKPIEFACKKCGEELNSFTDYCLNCKEDKRHFDKVVSVTIFDLVAKNLVHKLKYGNARYLADIIVKFMAKKFKEENFKNIDLILPVPLSEKRKKERGYNQAEELSLRLAKIFNIQHSSNIILRERHTQTQTHLTKQERKQNLLNAFKVENKEKIKDKNLLIIDDVITTGATFDEVAKVLKLNGAKSVYGLTFCHTKNNKV